MIEGLDSASQPNTAQVAAARQAGRRVWSGYLATRANVGLYSPWPTKAAFDIARGCGGKPIAFVSGWDDPVAVKAMAAAWNVRPCLDVEGHIRPDGPWVPGWLAASGSGLYGAAAVHAGRSAPFHIICVYPTSGDPAGVSWPSWTPRPAAPCGWQWAGTHSEFGIGVDSTWFDDWFGEGEMTPQIAEMFYRVGYFLIRDGEPSQAELDAWLAKPVDDATVLGNFVRILDSAEGIAYRAKLASIVAANPTTAAIDAEVRKVVAALPAGATVDQVKQLILTALGNLPVPAAAPAAKHHHGVLGIIDSGPPIAD